MCACVCVCVYLQYYKLTLHLCGHHQMTFQKEQHQTRQEDGKRLACQDNLVGQDLGQLPCSVYQHKYIYNHMYNVNVYM